jgi:hypothetical protein
MSDITWEGETCRVAEDGCAKIARSPDYNFNFRKDTGLFLRWGRTVDDDPQYSKFGPEIADIELSTDGCPNKCPFCYKGNTDAAPTNMTLDTFKVLLSKFPPTLTQIAFGITGIKTNPDLARIMRHCIDQGVIPNVTISGIDLDDDWAIALAAYCGAVAVSAYQTDKNVCYNAVKTLTDLGMKQVNIHLMTSAETMPFVREVIADRQTDERLKAMNAIVFLGVKPKGRAKDRFHSAAMDDFRDIIRVCLDREIGFGFDSCSAFVFDEIIQGMPLSDREKKSMRDMAEPCESALFSCYVNVRGEMWFCSFAEDEVGVEPVDVLNAGDFLRDVWYAPSTVLFRNRVIEARNARKSCHIHDIICP